MLLLQESTPTERAARITFLLVRGRELTAQEAADLFNVHISTAYRTLNAISRHVPIYRDETGVWRLLEPLEESISPY